jgi:hypothetical protein
MKFIFISLPIQGNDSSLSMEGDGSLFGDWERDQEGKKLRLSQDNVVLVFKPQAANYGKGVQEVS